MLLSLLFTAASLLATALCYITAPTLSPWWLLLLLPGFYLAAVLLFLLCAVAVPTLFFSRKQPSVYKPFLQTIICHMASWVRIFCGFRLIIRGADKLPDIPCLLVCNHRSAFDPILTIAGLKRLRKLVFVSKPEVLHIPIVGPFLLQASFLPIDRKNPRRAVETIRMAAQYITRRQLSVGIYPEGTRNTQKGLLPFHNGVFKIAKQAASPIVVTTIRYAGRRAYLSVAAVLDAEFVAASPSAVIGERVREIMKESLQED